MKRFVVLFALLITVQLSAQNFSAGKSSMFYVDLVSKASVLNGDWGLFGGMRAGINLDENFSIGLAGHGLIPVQLGKSYINVEGRDELHFGYGGVEASYKYYLSPKFYLSGNLFAGAGRVDYELLPSYDYFFIIEPGLSFNYNIIEWFGLGYQVNYRAASGVKYADFSNASFGGWSTDLAFKFSF